MKTTAKKKQPDIKLCYKIWLENEKGEGIMGDGKWKLLLAIENEGSITAATEALGWSYRKTWNSLKKIEKLLGFAIIQKNRGGKDGGSTELTKDGIRIVKAFEKFHSQVDGIMNKAFEKLLEEIVNK